MEKNIEGPSAYFNVTQWEHAVISRVWFRGVPGSSLDILLKSLYLCLSRRIKNLYVQQKTTPFRSNVQGSVHSKYILLYISNKKQRYTIYLSLETALHVSGGISTHHQEHIQLYLQHLALVKPLLLPAAIVEALELVPALPRNK